MTRPRVPDDSEPGSDTTGAGSECPPTPRPVDYVVKKPAPVSASVAPGDATAALAKLGDVGCKPQLPPIVKLAVHLTTALRPPDVRRIDIYPDGSGGNGDGARPAWAVVVIAQHWDGTSAIVGAAAARLTEVAEGFGIESGAGAIVPRAHSHTAEGVGAAWALRWARLAVAALDFPPRVEFAVWPDSEATVDAIRGDASARAYPLLGRILRGAFIALQNRVGHRAQIAVSHLPGHSMHP